MDLDGCGRGFRTALRQNCVSRMGARRRHHGGRHSPYRLVKDALEVALGECRALEVLVGANFAGADQSLLVRHGLHALLAQRLERGSIFAQVELGADEDDGDVGGVVVNLGKPLGVVVVSTAMAEGCVGVRADLGLDVVKRGWADNGEADEEDVRLRV